VVDAADSFAVTYVVKRRVPSREQVLSAPRCSDWPATSGVLRWCAELSRCLSGDAASSRNLCAVRVLGTAVGVMGTLQAHIVLALLLGLQPSPLGQLVTVDLRTLRFGGFSFAARRSRAERRSIHFSRPGGRSGILSSICAAWPRRPHQPLLRLCESTSTLWSVRNAFSSRAARRALLPSGVRAWRAARALQSRGHMECRAHCIRGVNPRAPPVLKKDRPAVLVIAATDSSGGAGLTRDVSGIG